MIRSTCFTITTIRTIKIIIGFQGLGLRVRGSEFRVRSCLVVGSGALWFLGLGRRGRVRSSKGLGFGVWV